MHFPSPLTQFPLKQKLLCRHFWMFTIVLHFYTLMNTILGIQLHETNRPVFSLAITSLISHCGCENNKRSPKNSDGQLKIQLKPEDNYLIFVVIRFYFDCFSSNDAFPTHISLFYQEYYLVINCADWLRRCFMTEIPQEAEAALLLPRAASRIAMQSSRIWMEE